MIKVGLHMIVRNESHNIVQCLYLFGGPSLTDYTQIVTGGVASNGVRISKGIVPGTVSGLVPSVVF